jgi:serine/threonine-protein kinase HipA
MSLDVYLNASPIGALSPASGSTDYSFSYSERVATEAEEGAVVLSHSLPVRPEAYEAIPTRIFFDGLLPEDARRDELARELKISSNDSYGLLAEIGRDCAGAVVIVPEGEVVGPPTGSVNWLNEDELNELVDRLPSQPLGVTKDKRKMRLSLAGAQRKLTLIRSGSGQFGEPQADAPSTHLIKPQYGDEYPDLAYNEMFCMRVARCLGLPAAETDLEFIADRPCLVSRRFDRSSSGITTTRLHQEDLCQALAVPTNLKYQSHGGPSFGQFRELLLEIGRGADVETMVRAAVCNYVLGNSDAHGKNFAILFTELGRRLAPLYDLVCTAVYDLEEEMAMSVGDAFEPESVGYTDWVDMSYDADLQLESFLGMVSGTASHVLECANSVAELARAEGWHVPIIDEIVDVARRRQSRIASQLASAAP